MEIVSYEPGHLTAVVGLAQASLDLPEDAGEAGAVVGRLLEPPAGQVAVRLVATGPDGSPAGVCFASLSRTDPTVGHVDLIAVHPDARRRGLARGLVGEAERRLAALGATQVRIAANPPCYAWPGIDVRYTPAVCLALALGYEHVRTGWNMTVDLAAVEDEAGEGTAAGARLAAAGVTVRRAVPDDIATVRDFAAANFGGDSWPWELEQSIGIGAAGGTAACHLAVRGTELLGFAAFGALRPSLFGPMGTAPAAQGMGIGGVLLRRCLLDQRRAGLDTAQIGWAGPIAFYCGTVGARIERVFLLYRRTLPARPPDDRPPDGAPPDGA